MKYNSMFHHSTSDGFPARFLEDVGKVIEATNMPCVMGAAPSIRKGILSLLQKEGWSNRIKVKGDLKLTITGIRDDTGLCIQFGNCARVYADLVKLQLAYNDSVIRRAIFIMPTKDVAKRIGNNLANFERTKQELDSLQHMFTVPLVVYGVFDE